MRTLTIAILALFAIAAASADVPLVTDGQARAVIVLPTEPLPVVRYAADELAYHIERATGVTLPVASEGDLPQAEAYVYLGATQAAAAAGIDVAELGWEETVLRSEGNRLFVIGQDEDGDPLAHDTNAGTLWGVYELIERELGVVWMWPGELGTHVPAVDEVVIGDLDERLEPQLLFRRTRSGLSYRIAERVTQGFTPEGLNVYENAQQTFLRRQRQGQSRSLEWGHAYGDWWNRYGEEHPDWFATPPEGFDPRHGWRSKLCVSNPEVAQQVIEEWKEAGAPDNWNVCPNDGIGFCTCDECRAMDNPPNQDPEKVWSAQGNQTARYVRFWNTLISEMRKTNPDVTLSTYAYTAYHRPPQELELEEGIIIGLVPPITFPMDDEAWDQFEALWMGWREAGANLFLRPNATLVGHTMPYNYMEQIGRVMHFVFDNGCVATDFDSLPGQWATMGPTMYTVCRIHTRPDLTTEKILDEYYSGFGPASDEIREYFDFWEQRLNEVILGDPEKRKLLWWQSFGAVEYQIYGPEQFEQTDEILQRAEAGAGNGVFGDRVDFIRLGWAHAKLCVEISMALTGANPDASPLLALDRLEELKQFRIEHEDTMFSNLKYASLIESRSWKLPDRPIQQRVRPVSEEVVELEGMPQIPIRGGSNFVAVLEEGEHFRAHLSNERHGHNPAAVSWHVIGPDDEHLAGGKVEVAETIDIDIEAGKPGQYMLMIQTFNNVGHVTMLNDHAALVGKRIDFLGSTSPLWVWVPEGCEEFTMTLDSQVPENAHCTVTAPDGTAMAEAETGEQEKITMTVVVPREHRGAGWQINVTPPVEGHFGDYGLEIIDGLSPYWSHAADRLVVPE